MKYLIFILALWLNNLALACVFYPESESVRMRLLNVGMLNLQEYKPFEYTSMNFDSWGTPVHNNRTENLQTWFDYLGGNVDLTSIEQCVYDLDKSDFFPLTTNRMILFLVQKEDFATLTYLQYAKKCEPYNSFGEDSWSDPSDAWRSNSMLMMRIGKRLMDQSEKPFLKRRYAHLIIRLAYYNQKYFILKKMFDETFKNGEKDLLYYWALYFKARSESDDSKANYLAAQVFSHSADKRMPVRTVYNQEIPLAKTLLHAQNDEEKANVMFMVATLKHDATLRTMQQAAKLGLDEKHLLFLLSREVNKLEDWILTPTLTHLDPPVSRTNLLPEKGLISRERLYQMRIQADKRYAREVLNFTVTLSLDKEKLSILQAHLYFLIDEHKTSLKITNDLLEQDIQNNEAINGLKCLKLLNSIYLLERDSPQLTPEIQALIFHFKDNARTLFCAGRALEFRGNTTDAAIIYSLLPHAGDAVYSDYDNGIYWSAYEDSDLYDLNYYSSVISDYFTYMDVVYEPKQVSALIKSIDANHSNSAFDSWYYQFVKQDRERIMDLLGTKYIRKDDLENAQRSFSKISKQYWISNYSQYDNSGFRWHHFFDQNPFYTLKYTENFIHDAKPFVLTKYSIVCKLLEYIELAKNPNDRNRDKYYLYIANCYANMTCTGNSWMMRRFYYSMYDFESFYPDESEFREATLAKYYYHLAAENSKNKKFKALCYFLAKDKKQLKKLKKEHEELKTYGCFLLKEYYQSR